jgi:hypothetical protein
MASRYKQLKKYGGVKTTNVDSDVLDSLEILVKASLEADFIYENETKLAAKKEKKPPVKGFVNKLVLKTLKVAEGMLAIMILKNPIKMGLAYNALHFAIKWLEEDIRKKQQKK